MEGGNCPRLKWSEMQAGDDQLRWVLGRMGKWLGLEGNTASGVCPFTRESRAAAEGRKGEVADAGEGWREERQ